MNKVRAYNELSDEEQEAAKNQYLKYVPISKIARDVGVARTTIQYHATRHWQVQREAMKAELFSEFHDTKRADFVKMSVSSIKIIQKALADLARREVPPSMREAKDAVTVLEALDKITRLDDGSPTEIMAEKPVSIEHIKKKLAMNPFNQETEEVEYKEVKNEDDK